MLSSGNGKLMIMSDVTNHPALFVRNPDWSAVFDMDADQARATRRRMLDMAATERAQVAFYHAPFPATGYHRQGRQRLRVRAGAVEHGGLRRFLKRRARLSPPSRRRATPGWRHPRRRPMNRMTGVS